MKIKQTNSAATKTPGGKGRKAVESRQEAVTYDATVKVFPTGKVAVIPCPWSADKDPVTPEGGNYSAAGRYISASDGRAEFRPYNISQHTRSSLRFSTAHGRIRTSDKGTTIHLTFDAALSFRVIGEMFLKEQYEIHEFLSQEGM